MKRLFALGMGSLLLTCAFADPLADLGTISEFDILPSPDNSLHIKMPQAQPVKVVTPTKSVAKKTQQAQNKKIFTKVKSKRLVSTVVIKPRLRPVKSVAMVHPAKAKKIAALSSKNHLKPLNNHLKKSLALNTHKYASKIDELFKKQKLASKKMKSKKVLT
jgi:hypothetical protein